MNTWNTLFKNSFVLWASGKKLEKLRLKNIRVVDIGLYFDKVAEVRVA